MLVVLLFEFRLGVMATFVTSCFVVDDVANEASAVSGNGSGDKAHGKEEWTDTGTGIWTRSTDSDVVGAITVSLPSLLRLQLSSEARSIFSGVARKDVIVD